MPGFTHIVPEPAETHFVRAGRFSFAFGRRTFLLCAGALVLLGPAFLNPRVLWAMLGWDAVVLLAWWIDLRMLPRPQAIGIRREFCGALSMGTAAGMRFSFTPVCRLPLRATLVADLPEQLSELPLERNILLRPSADNVLEFPITPRQRGDAQLDLVFLRYQSPLGLAERWARASLPQSVRVFPNTGNRHEQSLNLLRTRRIETMKRLSRRKGFGREFESLREYREGDALRDVCWTATARRGHLVTKEYRIERSQPVWIVLDCGRLMRTKVGEHTKLDFAVSAALNLAEVAMFGGDRVGLLAYGRGRPRVVALGRGEEHLRTIMDQLAVVRAEPGEADHYVAAGSLLAHQSRRALVVWLTDLPDSAMTPEVVESASILLGRHVVVFCAVADHDLNAAARERVQNAEEMFTAAAAMDVIYRRDRLIAALRGRGAHTLEVGTEAIASAIVSEYLSIKERELL